MKLIKKIAPWALSIALAPLMMACGDEAGTGESNSGDDEISIGGSLSQGASSSSLEALQVTLQSMVSSSAINGLTSTERTACTDGFFYGVACLNLATLDAEEGAVDCTGGGSFEVSGLPAGGAIGCFIKRYQTATAALSEGVNVGAIQIPAATLSGQTESIVAAGDVELAVIISDDGTINATVTAGNDNIDYTPDTSANTFTAANMDGLWKLACNGSGGNAQNVGRCKCFLGGPAVETAYPNGQDSCMLDPNGPGAAITTDVALGIDIHVLSADVNSDLDIGNNLVLPAGSEVNGISIWGATGEGTVSSPYVSTRTGGDGAATLNGALTWTTASATAAIGWSTAADIGGGQDVVIPAVPSNTATHSVWMEWLSDIALNAKAAGVNCNFSGISANEDDHIGCIIEYYDMVRDSGAVIPKIDIRPFCNPNGCRMSRNGAHTNDFDANAFNYARLQIEGLDFDYGDHGTDNSSIAAELDGMGAEPESRFVFEALEFFPGGAGFRTRDYDGRHFDCAVSGAEVNDNRCDTGNYFELRCDAREELSIKFLGSSSPVDMVFDKSQAVVYAELTEWTPNGPSRIQNVDALALCSQRMDQGGDAFFVKGTKQ